jgi:hypothetical protein
MRYEIVRRGDFYELFGDGKWLASEKDLYRAYEQILVFEGIELAVRL